MTKKKPNMFGMYDEDPKYLPIVDFSEEQRLRYFFLSAKTLCELTEAEKAELKQLYEYASDKNNILPEFKVSIHAHKSDESSITQKEEKSKKEE